MYETIATQPLQANLTADEEKQIMLKQKDILNKVKIYIDQELNPEKCSFYDKSK